MSARTAVGVFSVSALVVGGLAPAAAFANGHDKHSDKLSVKVCKQVKGDDDDGDDDGHDKFRFKGWTDEWTTHFSVRDEDCSEWLRFKYDERTFYLKEKNSDDYNVKFRVRGDFKKYSYNDNGKLKVWFYDDDPHLRIKVINKKDDNEHDD